jgi:hypothetical protein
MSEISYLGPLDKRRPKHDNSLRGHIDLQIVGLLEPINDMGKSWVPSKYKSVPKRPGGVAKLMES